MHEHIEHYNILFSDISFYTLASAILVAIAAGMLGCFVVWRKMSYFGDSLSHSALLGIVIGVVSGINPNITVFITCLAFSALILWLQQTKLFANDTILGILAHSAIALGMVVLGLVKYDHHVDEHDLLFGEIYNIGQHDFASILIGATIIISIIYVMWKKLVIYSISEDLAQGEGTNIFTVQLIFTLLITLTVALSIKLIGIILVTSLMIIPAATARQVSRSPRQMVVLSALSGVISVITGLIFATGLNLSPGPSIVVSATACFTLIALARGLKQQR